LRRTIPLALIPLVGTVLLGISACNPKSSQPTAQQAEEPAEPVVHAATLTNPNVDAPSEKLVNCTASIAPGEDPTPHIRPGATVCFKEGRHAVNLRIEVPITLVGEPGAILDGGGKGPVIHIAKDRVVVSIESLTLTNGYAEFGSGMLVDGYAKLALDKLHFEGNQAGKGGGAGLGARVGMLTLTDCSFAKDDDLIVTNIAKAELSNTTVAGQAVVLDGAKLVWSGGKVGTLTVRGTTTRAPEVKLVGVDGTVENDPNLPGQVTQE